MLGKAARVHSDLESASGETWNFLQFSEKSDHVWDLNNKAKRLQPLARLGVFKAKVREFGCF